MYDDGLPMLWKIRSQMRALMEPKKNIGIGGDIRTTGEVRGSSRPPKKNKTIVYLQLFTFNTSLLYIPFFHTYLCFFPVKGRNS